MLNEVEVSPILIRAEFDSDKPDLVSHLSALSCSKFMMQLLVSFEFKL